MEKEQFVKHIIELVAIKKAKDNLNVAFKEFEPDSNHVGFGRYETLCVCCLEFAVGDTSHWISYWLYDLNCGKEHLRLQVKDKNGKIVKMKTPADLFNCIKSL